jgi:hypothetical protein
MKTKKISVVLLFLSFTALFLIIPCRAATITWTNTAGGDWSVAANWSPNGVPGGSDSAAITRTGNYTVTVSSAGSIGTLTLGASSGDGTVQTLNIQSGTFTLSNASGGTAQGALGISGGTLNWSGGTMTGVMTISNNSVLNITAGGNTVYFTCRVVFKRRILCAIKRRILFGAPGEAGRR